MSSDIVEVQNTESALMDGTYGEHFSKEIQNLENELEDVESIYKNMQTLLDSISKNAQRGGRGGGSPLTFISKMYENMITIKNTKLSLIKEIVHVKKSIADLSIKDKNALKDKENSFREIAKEMLRHINSSGMDLSDGVNDIVVEVEESIDSLGELDSIAEKAFESETGISYNELANQRKSDKNDPDAEYFASYDGDVFVVTAYSEEGEIEDYEAVFNTSDFKVILNKEDEVESVINLMTGDEIEMYDLEEDESEEIEEE
jgi:hypothetical protein